MVRLGKTPGRLVDRYRRRASGILSAGCLVSFPEELSAMGQRGRSWMEAEFSWKGIGKRMTETYRWLCEKSLPVPPWVKLD